MFKIIIFILNITFILSQNTTKGPRQYFYTPLHHKEKDLIEQSKLYFSNETDTINWFSVKNRLGDYVGYAFWLNKRLYFPLHLLDNHIPGREGSVRFDLLVYDENLNPISTTRALREEQLIHKGSFDNRTKDLYSAPLTEFVNPVRLEIKNGSVFAKCWRDNQWSNRIYSIDGTSGFPFVFYIPWEGPKIWIARGENPITGELMPLLLENETYKMMIHKKVVFRGLPEFIKAGSCNHNRKTGGGISGRLPLSSSYNSFLKQLTNKNYKNW